MYNFVLDKYEPTVIVLLILHLCLRATIPRNLNKINLFKNIGNLISHVCLRIILYDKTRNLNNVL